jgi:hypothetical protein
MSLGRGAIGDSAHDIADPTSIAINDKQCKTDVFITLLLLSFSNEKAECPAALLSRDAQRAIASRNAG